MAAKSRRSRLWVDPGFQGRLLLRMAASLVLFAVFAWHFGFVLAALGEIATSTSASGLGELYAHYFRQQLPLFATFVLLVPALLYNFLKFSNRIAGPLYRCRQVMREMAQGKVVREFTPRKHDLMGDLFAAFNELIRTCNARAAAAPPAAEDAEVARAEPSGTHGAVK